jgi:hypothetical protein
MLAGWVLLRVTSAFAGLGFASVEERVFTIEHTQLTYASKSKSAIS